MADFRRRLAAITPEDAATSGRPLIYAFGWRYLEKITGLGARALRSWVKRGVKLEDPVEAVALAAAKKIGSEFADQLLEGLGYERRFTKQATRPDRDDGEV